MNENDVYSYRIETENERERYYVSFLNVKNEVVETEVSYDTFLSLHDFNKKQHSQSRSDRRHLERTEQTEISLNTKSLIKVLSMDESAIRNIENKNLYKAISKLPPIQQKRLKMYYFGGLKLREIADYENCSHQAVHKSIKRALMKLRVMLPKR